MVTLAKSAKRPEDWPVYWFAKLELAVESGDHRTAADVQKQLERLGVRVQYGIPARSTTTEATHDASR